MGARKSSSGPLSRLNRASLDQGSGDGASGAAKIGLVATLLAALVAGRPRTGVLCMSAALRLGREGI